MVDQSTNPTMEVYTKAPTEFRIENVNVSSSGESRLEKYIFIELVTENDKHKTIRMSALQLNNLQHNVENLLKQTNHFKTKLQQN